MDVQALNRQGLSLPGNAKAVVDQLVCGICLDIFLTPVQCHKGGHTYCLHCITEHTRGNPKCPGGCNVEFPTEPTRNISIQGIIDSLECRCPNAPAPAAVVPEGPAAKKIKVEGGDAKNPIVIESAGGSSSGSSSSSSSTSGAVVAAGQCTWTGPFGQLRDHLERCGLEPCGIQGCAFEGKGGVLAAHRLACPKRPVPCPHCQAATALDSLERHLAVCEEVPVACPFACTGCPTILARKSMPAHIASNAAQHAALADAYLQNQPVPSASIELTIKNVQQKIAEEADVYSPRVPFPLAGFPQGQVFLRVRFGGSDNGVQRDGKTLSVYAYFTCPSAPAVEPPPEICFQGTIITLVSQDGAVKNVEWCMTSLDHKARLGNGFGWPDFCQDVTPFVKDDTIVVRTTIRARPAAPAAATIKHTVA